MFLLKLLKDQFIYCSQRFFKSCVFEKFLDNETTIIYGDGRKPD